MWTGCEKPVLYPTTCASFKFILTFTTFWLHVTCASVLVYYVTLLSEANPGIFGGTARKLAIFAPP